MLVGAFGRVCDYPAASGSTARQAVGQHEVVATDGIEPSRPRIECPIALLHGPARYREMAVLKLVKTVGTHGSLRLIAESEATIDACHKHFQDFAALYLVPRLSGLSRRQSNGALRAQSLAWPTRPASELGKLTED